MEPTRAIGDSNPNVWVQRQGPFFVPRRNEKAWHDREHTESRNHLGRKPIPVVGDVEYSTTSMMRQRPVHKQTAFCAESSQSHVEHTSRRIEMPLGPGWFFSRGPRAPFPLCPPVDVGGRTLLGVSLLIVNTTEAHGATPTPIVRTSPNCAMKATCNDAKLETERECSGLAVVSHQAGLKNIPANEGVNSLMRKLCFDDTKCEPRSRCLRMD